MIQPLEQIIDIHCHYRIGDGQQVNFWQDKWYGSIPFKIYFSSLFEICNKKEYTVAEVLTKRDAFTFSRQLSMVQHQEMNELYGIIHKISLSSVADIIVWGNSDKGSFSTNILYDWLLDEIYKNIWQLQIPLKHKIFLWLIFKKKILTRVHLRQKGWDGDVKCVYCPKDESLDHLFFRCTHSTLIWLWFTKQFKKGIRFKNLQELVFFVESHSSKAIQIWCCAIMWIIWIKRNEICFQNSKIHSIRSIAGDINALIHHWTVLWKEALKKEVLLLMSAVEDLPKQLTGGPTMVHADV